MSVSGAVFYVGATGTGQGNNKNTLKNSIAKNLRLLAMVRQG